MSVYPDASAVYTLTGTNASGCSNIVIVQVAVDECLGLSRAETSLIKVFPNPGNGIFHIEGAKGILSLTVTDVTGRVILDQKSSEAMVDLRTQAPGIYYLNITGEGRQGVFKIVKD